MTAGLPTDDPWGDRQQGLAIDDVRALPRRRRVARGPARRPLRVFEPRLRDPRPDRRERDRRRSTAPRFATGSSSPLGLRAGFDVDAIPPELRATGYVRRADAWQEEPIDGHGAFAPMGGLWASVRDLARWVGEFTDAFPARDDPDDGHPLRRASRREMQQAHAAMAPELSWTSADAAPDLQSAGYGYGLFVLHDLALGRVVGHGGGYPGFGSHMRWHPASGLGVVALANARYAPVGRLTLEALRILVPSAARARPAAGAVARDGCRARRGRASARELGRRGRERPVRDERRARRTAGGSPGRVREAPGEPRRADAGRTRYGDDVGAGAPGVVAARRARPRPDRDDPGPRVAAAGPVARGHVRAGAVAAAGRHRGADRRRSSRRPAPRGPTTSSSRPRSTDRRSSAPFERRRPASVPSSWAPCSRATARRPRPGA